MKNSLNFRRWAFSCLMISAPLASGCGPSAPALPPGPINPTAVSDRRIRFKEEYKQVLGKDGRVRMNPALLRKYQQSTGQSKQ
jgi:hypothetical protein